MTPGIVEHLHAAGAVSDLDRNFARLLERLAGAADGSLGLAAALASRASAEGNICLDLAGLAGRPVATGGATPCCPALEPWLSALRRTAVVGAPGDWRPLVLDGARLYLYRYWDAEQGLGRFLRERSRGTAPAVDAALLREGIERLFPDRDGETDWQRAAAAVAVLQPFCVITGGPGTGKTTTVARVLALLLEQAKGRPLRLALAAPTGKAAARLQESIRQSAGRLACADGIRQTLAGMEASTLHRLLGGRPAFSAYARDEEEPLPFDAVLVDEASMVSLHLLYGLARTLSPDARLILLGDRDQLASVEAGAVLGDICGPSAGACTRARPGNGSPRRAARPCRSCRRRRADRPSETASSSSRGITVSAPQAGSASWPGRSGSQARTRRFPVCRGPAAAISASDPCPDPAT